MTRVWKGRKGGAARARKMAAARYERAYAAAEAIRLSHLAAIAEHTMKELVDAVIEAWENRGE